MKPIPISVSMTPAFRLSVNFLLDFSSLYIFSKKFGSISAPFSIALMRTSIFLLIALVFALVISQTHITGSTQQTAMQTIKGINFTIIFSFILYFTCEPSPGPPHLVGLTERGAIALLSSASQIQTSLIGFGLTERFAFAQLSPVSPIQAGLIGFGLTERSYI